MKKLCKAFVAIVLMLAMSLSLIPAHATEQGEITVCFDNTALWSEVYFYYWSDDNFDMIQWPGEPAQLVGSSIHRAVLPEKAQYVIFHNNNGTQTLNLEIPGDGMLYTWSTKEWTSDVDCIHDWQDRVITEPGCKTIGSVKRSCTLCDLTVYETLDELGHDYVDGVCTRCGKDMASAMTLYFDNTALWETVYVYFWADGISMTEWPGEPATCLGSTVWEAEVPGGAEYVIFSSGGGYQTADLDIPGDGQIYTWSNKQWVPYNGCIHQWQETVVTEAQCGTEGLSVKICSACSKREDIILPPLGHAFEEDVCIRCGLDRTGTFTVYLINDGFGWETPYIYCWWDGGSDTWPGKPMEDLGNGLFSCQISAEATGVLFNDGQGVEHSYDLEVPGDGYVYNSLTGNWKVLGEEYHIWDEGVYITEPNCTSGGEIVYTCTICGVSNTHYIEACGHSWENGVCTACGRVRPDSYELYFHNENQWEQVYVYYWNSKNEEMTLWPGEKMTLLDSGVYGCEIPGDAEYVIFSDGQSGGWQTFDLIIPDTGYLFKLNEGWICYAGTALTISGSITSYGDPQENVGVYLWRDTDMIDYQVISGTTAQYCFVDVAPGTYTLQVIKENHVDAEYTIVVETESVVQDVKLCYTGDVTGDGKVNMADVARAFAHVRGKNPITDDYTLLCADTTGDGKTNMADIARIFAHVRGKTKLF